MKLSSSFTNCGTLVKYNIRLMQITSFSDGTSNSTSISDSTSKSSSSNLALRPLITYSPRLWQTADLLALCRHPSACVSQPAAAAAAATVAADIATA
ncbi:hypothetical protein HZH68_000597 [Vespula germanica]|uniref:Uncharacterized protein n=1 Tax=Vespula germanica TaxID=30212 RepID=A0A834NTW3_VESGE|nr:hypothetical protein HZH68_000597 [Vespula germanica]